MKYAFVSLSIIAIWIAFVLMIIFLEYEGIILPMIALIMTVILFILGFGDKS